ncbi:ABC transporter substrate-binding protein [Paenibacillus sp. N3.4]|uniref:ABC transporter substrate-binding protein n=1 Tax=Paenibacillus sp. N3.4 TaxID=2603222 RepID=UPI00164F2700|nr:ABC transporter substrate-binding protein [Paenibacillus sp. N3.4]
MRKKRIHFSFQAMCFLIVTLQLVGCSSISPQKAAPLNAAQKESSTYEITLYYYTSTQRDLSEVEKEISKITKERIDATVKLMPYMSSVELKRLMVAPNHKQIDLMLAGSSTLNALIEGDQLIPLNHLLATQGKDIQKVLGSDILDSVNRMGGIYGVPSMRDLATNYGIVMRKDLIDKYKINLAQMNKVTDLPSVFQTIQENEPGITPLVPYKGTIYGGIRSGTYDELDDSIGILPGYDNEFQIVNLYDSEQYAKDLDMIRNWYLSGYIDKDVVFTRDSAAELVRAGKAFAYFSPLKPNVEKQEARLTGYPMIAVPFTSPVMTTKQLNTSIMTIHKNSLNPEKAMSFLNLLYSDERIVNLLDNGIEGKHYVQVAPYIIDYPAGINASNTGYSYNSWGIGNQFISRIWNGDDSDLWLKMDAFNKHAHMSKALGFTFDWVPVKAEYAAVKSILSQYVMALETGTYDPKEKLSEFRLRLKSAGIDRIIAEKQQQLLLWNQNKQYHANMVEGPDE